MFIFLYFSFAHELVNTSAGSIPLFKAGSLILQIDSILVNQLSLNYLLLLKRDLNGRIGRIFIYRFTVML